MKARKDGVSKVKKSASRGKASSNGKTWRGQRTVDRILDVAEKLFAQGSYGTISLRDIAERAGLQQPGLYKHFKNKEELYQRVYDRALQPLSDVMEDILAGPDDMAMIDDLGGRLTDLLAQHPNITQLLLRANTRSPTEQDDVAVEWLQRLTDYGRRLTEKSGTTTENRLLAVQIVAVYNVLFGYFTSAPLIETLSGVRADDLAMLAIQKNVLRGLVGSFSQGMNDGQEPAQKGE